MMTRMKDLRQDDTVSKNQDGFTLVELLVSIALLAVLSTLLLSAIRPTVSALLDGTKEIDRNTELVGAQDMVSKYLKSAVNLSHHPHFQSNASGLLGTKDRVEFFAHLPEFVGGDITKFELSFRQEHVGQLVLSTLIPRREETESFVLLENVDAMEISYFGSPDNTGDEARWYTEWEESDYLPRLIRVDLECDVCASAILQVAMVSN